MEFSDKKIVNQINFKLELVTQHEWTSETENYNEKIY